MTSNLVREQLRQLSASPGVYLMRDAEGTILYVGKAANLHHRARSYFVSGQQLSPKLERMVARVADLDFFVTSSEQEALILELNLIKRHHPHYNVRLKDDKTFPYLKIDMADKWPRLYITRRLEDDGGRYFGPFASAKSVRQTLKVIKEIFPFRSCSKTISSTDSRACLAYDIGDCAAPCIGAVSQKEYADIIKQVTLFLEGKEQKIIRHLESKMNKAAEAMEFETAALYRDRIQAIRQVIEGQRIATKVRGEQDAIAFAQDKDYACVQVFFIRNNRLIGRESFTLQGTLHEEPEQIMTGFIKQFYSSSAYIPPVLLLQHTVEDISVIKDWLRSKRGANVDIQIPRRGSKKQLVDIVAENAKQCLEQLKIRQLATPQVVDEALVELESVLNLPHPPWRLEAYDISDIQGKLAVGSMVVFEKGRPKPAHYRRFRIKTVPSANDYAMLQEILKRRFKQSSTSTEEWATMPDLILIDGGKGQLSAAREAMGEAGVNSIPIASLAKENEELFIPQQTGPIMLPRNSPGLQLLQRLRDEAHRFAINYYQKIHKRETFASVLDTVPGIGSKRKRHLLRQFGSIQGIREAPEEKLAAVKGMTKSLAKKIKEYL